MGFHFWTLVEGKDLSGIFYVSITELKDQKEKGQWKTKNARVTTWILNSVEIDIALSLRPFNTAFEI